jgi:dTDP-4-amino-4,6-dideoxygalactose transaminase
MPTSHSPLATRNSAPAVPGLDLQAQYTSIKDEIDAAVADVFASQQFIMGPQVRECEEAIAQYCQSPHAVGVSSGTDALLIALMAEQIGPGDEVITTPYSFFATAGCVARVGATPVFVDIDPATFNIDPHLIESKISDKTKAIIPVHLFGQMADMDPIMEIARRRNLVVIEDAAQAIGAEYKGRRAGSIGDYGCYSFFPAKNLGCAGDGGLVVTNDANRAERLRVLRVHGSKPKYYHHVIGGNFRLDTLQAAIVTVKLRHLDRWTKARQQIATRYNELFSETGLVQRGLVTLPPSTLNSQPSTPSRHVYNQYVCRVDRRDELLSHLNSCNIATAVYYPRSLHEQECFAYLGHKSDDFPESKKAADESLALPIYPELTDEQQQRVVKEIQTFFATRT